VIKNCETPCYSRQRYRSKTYPSATLSTTNTTWSGPDTNRGFCDGRPATNRLSYGTGLKHLDILHIKGIMHIYTLLFHTALTT
jgi:hypothetical protein